MKRLYVAIAFTLAMSVCAASAMAWGSATHAYIDERLNNKGPLLKLNQVYGGMATDVFGFMADPLQAGYLGAAVHCADGKKMWRASFLPTTKAQAYGFISHNQAWGADHTAHNYSCPDNLPPTEGYIQDKAETLFPSLPAVLQTPEGMELLRNAVEYAVDILLISKDPAIGAKVSAAALLRSPEFPLLLNSTFAQGFSQVFHLNYFKATQIISAAELQFRQAMLGYGQMLSQGPSKAIEQISAQAVLLAQQLYGVSLDLDLVETMIGAAMNLCAPDYMDNINATINAVRGEMSSRGFSY